MHACMYICMYVSMLVCVYAYKEVQSCRHAVCMYVYMYVCMYVCMLVWEFLSADLRCMDFDFFDVCMCVFLTYVCVCS